MLTRTVAHQGLLQQRMYRVFIYVFQLSYLRILENFLTYEYILYH